MIQPLGGRPEFELQLKPCGPLFPGSSPRRQPGLLARTGVLMAALAASHCIHANVSACTCIHANRRRCDVQALESEAAV